MSDDVFSDGISKTVIPGMLWQYSGVAIKALLQIAVISVLSRLLLPKDFGLISIASIFTVLATLISQVGVGQALVQRKNITEMHLRVGFSISVFLGILFMLTLWALSKPIASFFNDEGVAPVLRWLSLSFFFVSWGVIASSTLQRDFCFRQLMWVDILSYTIGYLIFGLPMAYLGYGVWALVASQLVQSLAQSLAYYRLKPHSIRPMYDRIVARDLLNFGFGFTIARLFNYAANNGDYFVVGRILGATLLGFYTRAYQLMLLPAQFIAVALEKVLFPVLAKIQDDNKRLTTYFFINTYMLVLVSAPAGIFLVINANHIVRVLLGNGWLDAVVPFQILSLSVVFRTTYKASDLLATATGAVYGRALRELIYAVIVIVGAFLGTRYGLEGVAIAVSFAILANYIMAIVMSKKILGFSWQDLRDSHLPGLALATLAFVVMALLEKIYATLGVPSIVVLVVSFVTYLLVVVAMIVVKPQLLGRYGKILFNTLAGFLPFRVRDTFIVKRITQQ